MYFCSLASGSSGNCLYVETSKSKFLIDCGLSGLKIQKRMEASGLRAQDLDFILLTHEHSDHSKGLGVLSRRFNLPIFSNENTYTAMEKKLGKIKDENKKVFKTGQDFSYRDLDISPLRIYHDAIDPVGFIIRSEGKKLSFLTDTGYTTGEMEEAIKGSDMYFLEANYDQNMLANGPYPERLKMRISGDRGHLSNEDSARFLERVLKRGNEKVYLGHLSKNNNLPILAKTTVEDYLIQEGADQESINVEIAKRYSPNRVYEIV